MLVDATRFPAWVNVLELVDLYWDEVGIDMNISGISGELLTERKEGNAYDAMADFSDGGLATLLNPGSFLMPCERRQRLRSGMGRMVRPGHLRRRTAGTAGCCQAATGSLRPGQGDRRSRRAA
jgi:hypothetical protein